MINAKSQCTPMLNSHNLARSTMMVSIKKQYVLLVMARNIDRRNNNTYRYQNRSCNPFFFSQLFVSFVCDFLSLRSRSFSIRFLYLYFLNMLRHCNAYALFYVLVVGMFNLNCMKSLIYINKFRIFRHVCSLKFPNIYRGMLR